MTSMVKRQLTYLIQFKILAQARKSQLEDNVKYEILKLRAVMDLISNMEKMIPSGTYAGRELLSVLEGMVELNKFLADDQVTKMNKLKGITEMIINLDELDNTNNLEDGRPSNSF